MKRNKTQCGHTLVEHVIQFALMAGIIVAIIYACGGQGEESLPVKTKTTPTAAAPAMRRQPSVYQSSPNTQRAATMTANVNVPGGYQPIGDPRLIQRSNPRMTPKNISQESTSVQRPPMDMIAQEPAATTTPVPEDTETITTSAATSVAHSDNRADMRVVRVRQEDPERMGRVIIIVAVIALAVIVFWFIHSNMMYKRTLRAVAATHPKPEDNPPPSSAPAASAPAPVETSVAKSTIVDGEHAVKNSIVGRLAQLKEMFDQGLISQEDYDAKKKDILAHL
jgi:hypothetical protein